MLIFAMGEIYYIPYEELVSANMIPLYANLFEKFYGKDYCDMFFEAVKVQKILYENISLLSYIKLLFISLIRSCLFQIKPLYFFIKKRK
jgi:hypothetical protein